MILNLSIRDKQLLLKFFNTSGYVFDFSTERFNDFAYESIGIKIAEKYNTSKGKSLESYFKDAEGNEIIKLCVDLLNYYGDNKAVLDEIFLENDLYDKCKNLLGSLSSNIISKSREKQFTIFISHSNLDKEMYVKELVEEIRKLNVKVWYDEESVLFGDNLFEKIYSGLEKCEFGIIILSKNFLKSEWCKKELTIMRKREFSEKRKIILPVLYRCAYDEGVKCYPFLSDKYMLSAQDKSCADIAIYLANEFFNRIGAHNDK